MNDEQVAQLWKKLGDIQVSIFNVDKKLSEHLAQSNSIEEKISDHNKKLYGNGNEGLIIKVDRLDECHKKMSKLTWVVIGALVPLFITAAWSFFKPNIQTPQGIDITMHKSAKP